MIHERLARSMVADDRMGLAVQDSGYDTGYVSGVVLQSGRLQVLYVPHMNPYRADSE